MAETILKEYGTGGGSSRYGSQGDMPYFDMRVNTPLYDCHYGGIIEIISKQ